MTTIATWAFSASLDTAANLRGHLACIDEAAGQGADLVVFPEISVQGYRSAPGPGGQREMLADAYARAEPVPGGSSVRAIAAKAAQRRVHVVFGICESAPEPGILYNTLVLVGPDGYLGRYRKVHLGPPERVIWAHGRDWPVFETPVGRIGLLICYDNLFPESCRELTLRGADILVMSTGWSVLPGEADLASSQNADRYLLFARARAIENTRWFVSSNYAGRLGARDYFGRSQIVDPAGRVVADTGTEPGQAMALARVDVRQGILDAYAGYLGTNIPRDRHPETYTASGGQSRPPVNYLQAAASAPLPLGNVPTVRYIDHHIPCRLSFGET